MAENLLSKVKIGDVTYNLKDARVNTLLGEHALAALANTAWTATATAITGSDNIPTDVAVKTYVEAEVAKVNKFDVVVCEADATKIPKGAKYIDGSTEITGTMEAGSTTMYKIYFVKNSKAGTGAYAEYLTIRTGTEGSYVYTWEMIGSTVVDLEDYIKKNEITTGSTNGTIRIKDQIDVAVKGLDALAYKASASGTVAGQTITGVTASYTPAGSITVNALTQTATDATLTKGDYTPAGSITGSAISGGSINVTLKDKTTATEATLTTATYTPAGTVDATDGGSFSALKSAVFAEDAEDGVQIAGTINKPDITITAGTEKTFATGLTGGSVASIDVEKFSGGSFTGATAASFTQGAKASFTQGSKAALTTSNISYIEEGVKVEVDTTDTEMLVFTNVTAKSAKAVDTFTANGDDSFTANGDDSFTANNVGTFTAATIENGFFTANTLQSITTDKVHDTPTAALATTPTFTGNKYKISTTADTALKEVAFTATNSADIVNKVEYVQQEVDAKTFTPTAATLGFSGTKAENVLVTGVSYDKATANGATFAGTEGEANVGDITVASKDVTVS